MAAAAPAGAFFAFGCQALQASRVNFHGEKGLIAMVLWYLEGQAACPPEILGPKVCVHMNRGLLQVRERLLHA